MSASRSTRGARPSSICACGNHAWAPITKGFVALVSPEDKQVLDERAWNAAVRGGRIYAEARIGHRLTYLHRWLFCPDAPPSIRPDHIHHNGLDNRRSEVRVGTHAENNLNRRPGQKACRYKGVSAGRNPKRPYLAKISRDGRDFSLGSHETEEDAARAYDNAARELHGPFAYLNFGAGANQ